MQEIVRNSFNGSDSLKDLLHLKTASNLSLFNSQFMLTSESDDECNSDTEDFNVHFYQNPSQDFGLEYWINHTNHNLYESLSSHCKSQKDLTLISKSESIDDNVVKPITPTDEKVEKKSKKRNSKIHKTIKKAKVKKSASSSKFNSTKSNYNIPRLKIPKEVVKKYLKTLSPWSSSSSSSSESDSSHNQRIMDKINESSPKSNQSLSETVHKSDCNDSSCLQKSFLRSNYSKQNSVSLITVASHDNMLLSIILDKNSVSDLSSLPVINSSISRSNDTSEFRQLDLCENNPQTDVESTKINKSKVTSNEISAHHNKNDKNNIDSEHLNLKKSDEGQYCLSTNCDNQKLNHNTIKEVNKDFETLYNLTPVTNKSKENNTESENIAKNTNIETVDSFPKKVNGKLPCGVKVLDYVRLFMDKMKYFEEMMHEKYCLSQPNAMKFLAQNHANNWESYKNDMSQLHLVPSEFIAEIFHRALHCYGLEKRTLKETSAVDSSPSIRPELINSAEYKKIRDEYSFSIKRVRYGIGVIDDLFKRKITFQTTQPNNDVMVVRKWKHLIYYLCLQAKAVFMTKEMYYHNYANYTTSSSSFDEDCNFLFNTTPTARNSSSLIVDSHNKLQCSKDNPRSFESKFIKTSPEHLSQFDMDVSPHSYDSGKGSSIQLSSNGNSQVSGSHTTSSLNSTPHSFNESQLNLPGFHMYRVDEYLKTANEFIHFLPETLQLHNKIISKVGFEPNANSSDNMLRFINYTEICQQMCKQDALPLCLQRLLSQAAVRL